MRGEFFLNSGQKLVDPDWLKNSNRKYRLQYVVAICVNIVYFY